MKIRHIALVCASMIFATTTLAGDDNCHLPKHVDNIYLWGPSNTILRVVEIGPIDATLAVSLINDHQIRVSRPHLHHGTWTAHVAMNETDHCTVTIEAGGLNQKIQYQKCTGAWKVNMKHTGLYSYNLQFSPSC